jgi:GWxTD domain-containing protein
MTLSTARSYALILSLTLLQCLPALLSQSQYDADSTSNKGRVLRLDGGAPLFKAWLDQDVVWIITPEERNAFKALRNDEQRNEFVEAFWSRRNPTPDSYENEFKDEHYRRIAYANDHFAAQDAGWNTDRGRILIVYGPPDHVATYSARDSRPRARDGQDYNGLPSETWNYRYLEGVGMDVAIDFVDICSCGDYRMRMPDELGDALLVIPSELSAIRKTHVKSVDPELYLWAAVAPKGKFTELEEKLNSKSGLSVVPLEVSTEVTKATDITSIVHVKVSFQNRDIIQQELEASIPATLNVYGQVRSLTGHIVGRFEGTLDVNESDASELRFQKDIALINARYRLEVAAEVAHTRKATAWIGLLNTGQ